MEGWGYVRMWRFVKIGRKIDGAMSGVLVALLVLGYNILQWVCEKYGGGKYAESTLKNFHLCG